MLQRITTTLCFAAAASIGLLLTGAAQASVADGLSAYVPLDETSGTDVFSIGLGTGVNAGADMGVAAVIGTGFHFTASEDDAVNFNGATNTATNITNAFSFSAFIQADSYSTEGGANGRNGVMFGYLGFGTLNGRVHILFKNAAGAYVDGLTANAATALTAGPDFHHIAATRAADTVKFYIDGIHVDTLTGIDSTDVQNSKVRVGTAGTTRDWDGVIDDIGLFDDVLSDQEIALINGLGRFAGVALNDTAIDDVLTAFNTGTGNSASAGGYTWSYATSLGAGPIGTVGGSVGSSDAFIILDASGNGVQITAVSFHPGDANGDGMVNLADLQILGDNWQSTTASWSEADFNGDGNVNLADLQIIGDNWGFGVSADLSFDKALAGVAIPEPACISLLGLASGLILIRR